MLVRIQLSSSNTITCNNETITKNNSNAVKISNSYLALIINGCVPLEISRPSSSGPLPIA